MTDSVPAMAAAAAESTGISVCPGSNPASNAATRWCRMHLIESGRHGQCAGAIATSTPLRAVLDARNKAHSAGFDNSCTQRRRLARIASSSAGLMSRGYCCKRCFSSGRRVSTVRNASKEDVATAEFAVMLTTDIQRVRCTPRSDVPGRAAGRFEYIFIDSIWVVEGAADLQAVTKRLGWKETGMRFVAG